MADFVNDVAPWLGAIGQSLIDLDEDQIGTDDFVGNLFVYIADVGSAIKSGGDIPDFPEPIKSGVTGRITGTLRAVLQIVNPLLMFASFQVKDAKAKIALRYANQALTLLLAGKTVPAFGK